MNSRGKKMVLVVVIAILKSIFGLLRFTLYVLLLLVGRVLEPITNLAIVAGLILFLGFLIVWREQVTPMWAGAALAFGGMMVKVLYQAVLSLVAPEGTVIISEL